MCVAGEDAVCWWWIDWCRNALSRIPKSRFKVKKRSHMHPILSSRLLSGYRTDWRNIAPVCLRHCHSAISRRLCAQLPEYFRGESLDKSIIHLNRQRDTAGLSDTLYHFGTILFPFNIIQVVFKNPIFEHYWK